MRHKMVNLCPTTYEIAAKMHNFSGYVRRVMLEAKDLEYLESELTRMSKLLDDIIEGKKKFIPNKGWVKNMYHEYDEDAS